MIPFLTPSTKVFSPTIMHGRPPHLTAPPSGLRGCANRTPSAIRASRFFASEFVSMPAPSLENIVEPAFVLCRGGLIEARHLRPRTSTAKPSGGHAGRRDDPAGDGETLDRGGACALGRKPTPQELGNNPSFTASLRRSNSNPCWRTATTSAVSRILHDSQTGTEKARSCRRRYLVACLVAKSMASGAPVYHPEGLP